MTDSELRPALEKLLQEPTRCLCGMGELCETCNPYSAYNRLRGQLRVLVNSPDPKPTLDDYGRSVKIKL